MTLVDADTGEVIAFLTTDEAREMTDRIKVGVEAVWELVKECYQRGAHRALGYSSWDDYCTREFGTARIRLPREERQEVVTSLRDAGLSIRAISAATGTGTRQVQEALSERGDDVCSQNTPDGEDAEVGYSFKPVDLDPETGDKPVKDEDADRRVTGTDGKSYPAMDRDAVRARRKRIRELHQSGHSNGQIADELGMSSEAVSQNIKAMGLTAVKSRDRGGKKDKTVAAAVARIITSVSAIPIAVRGTRLDQLDLSDVSPEDVAVWRADLSEAIKALRALQSALKGE